jgi:halimadienyl-diphosphate synthase
MKSSSEGILRKSFVELLSSMGRGHMLETAYDTAWAARLHEQDKELSDKAILWITENQLRDGSWGAAEPFYYHDRVICTLAAMTMLAKRGRRASDSRQLTYGQEALERITAGATQGLLRDANGSTVGFEMIAPTLVAEAEALDLMGRQGDRILGRLSKARTAKLAKLNGKKVNRYMTAAFSAEMAGPDARQMLDVNCLQEGNGSVAHSPSATAYYAMHVKEGDSQAMAYLRNIALPNGGVPNVAPFDIFEPAWILWNLSLAGPIDDVLKTLCNPHLDYLQQHWKTGQGIGSWVAQYVPSDGDATGLVFDVLHRFGRTVDIEAIFHYEEDDYFRCFAMEANPSISTNIHILGALKQSGFDRDHPAVTKVIHYLRQKRMMDAFWFDKWHASPYYATGHCIIACSEYDRDMAAAAVNWIENNQKSDGSWGFYMSTAEETAYCLQALCCWMRQGGKVEPECIANGKSWLSDHAEMPYPPLWIGKCLYSPYLVVQSAVLSALIMAAE